VLATDANAFLFMALVLVKSQNLDGSEELERAYFKASGLQATAEVWERDRLPRDLRIVGGNIALATRTLVDRRITFKWSF
jgi:hypothetical protein